MNATDGFCHVLRARARLARPLALWAATAALACFSPSYPTGQPCTEDLRCPPGQACVESVCLPADGLRDAGPDAAVVARDVEQLALGGAHTCALLDGGDVMCWGQADAGQLGYGSTQTIGADPDHLPRTAGLVDVGGPVQALAAGESHTCALLTTGEVRCWGSNALGQLGNATPMDIIGDDETPASRTPVRLSGLASHIAAGRDHTCVLLQGTSQLQCWGAAGPHLGYGMALGESPIGDDESPADVGSVVLPKEVSRVTAGSDHTCVLFTDGGVMCWGRAAYGQPGYASVLDQWEPPTSPLQSQQPATAVSAGADHTCARMGDGTVRCWGRGEHGRLGHGNVDNLGDDEPGLATAVVPVGEFVQAVTAGGSHSCALLVSGTVRCWGNSAAGRLGTGNTRDTPEDIGDDEPAMAGLVTPLINMAQGESVVAVVAGGAHTCAIVEVVEGDGARARRVRCWGAGASGALGYGATDSVGEVDTPLVTGDVPLY